MPASRRTSISLDENVPEDAAPTLSDSVSSGIMSDIRTSFAQGDSFWDFWNEDGSEWEEGLAALESILRPGSAANVALTRAQENGLHKVKEILLGAQEKSQIMLHIPRELFNDTGSSSDYLLAQFAGVKRRNTKMKMKNIVNANRFVTGLKLKAESSTTLMQKHAFIPDEWRMLEPEEQIPIAKMLSWENLESWDFDVFELARLTKNQPLLFLGWAILSSPYSQEVMQAVLEGGSEKNQNTVDTPGYHFVDTYRIPQASMVNFLKAIEADYNHDIPYHNNIHAADVLQSLHSLLSGMDGKQYATSDLELFSILLASVVHDVGHQGYNNNFQVNAKSDLALNYNDVSVLENMHAASAFKRLLGSKKDPKINIFSGMKPQQIISCREMVIAAVLGTDMTKHFGTVNKIKGILLNNREDTTQIKGEEAWEVLHYVLHLADISNQAKRQELAYKWTENCLNEFFRQGDEEKKLGLPVSPLCDRATTKRPDSQIGFIKFVVLPAFEILGRCIKDVDKHVVPRILENLKFWKKEKYREDQMTRIEEGMTAHSLSESQNDDTKEPVVPIQN